MHSHVIAFLHSRNAIYVTTFFTVDFRNPDPISDIHQLLTAVLHFPNNAVFYEFQFSLQLLFSFIYYLDYSLMQGDHSDNEGIFRLLS